MAPSDLRAAGEALYGPRRWQGGLAELLIGKPSSQTSRIRNWLAGETIPAWVKPKLIAELRRRAALASKTADRLASIAD